MRFILKAGRESGWSDLRQIAAESKLAVANLT